MPTNQVTCYSNECELAFPHREGSRGCRYHYQAILDALADARFGDDRDMIDSSRAADAQAINNETQLEYR